MTFDWATERLLDQLADRDPRLRRPRSVQDLQLLSHWLAGENGLGPELDSVTDVALVNSDGAPPRLRVFRPRTAVPAVVVYMPGPAWGWVAGSLETSDTVCRKLAERSGCTFILLEHRKAPQYRFSDLVDDASRAVSWAEDYRQELPTATPPLVVMGEGSGGTLAAVLTRRSAALEAPPIGLQVLVSPCLDASALRRPGRQRFDGGLLDPAMMSELWNMYIPNPADHLSPDAVPMRAGDFDFAGHAPTDLLAASDDPLHDEGQEYLARLNSAGVRTNSHTFAGQMHGFFGIMSLPLGERAFQAVIRRLRQYVARADSPVAA